MRAPKASADQVKSFNDTIGKNIRTIWVLFVIGVLSEALKINPQKITMSGVEFLIQNGKYIAGMLYILCVILYVVLLISLVFGALSMHMSATYSIRVALYRAIGPRNHITKLTRSQLLHRKNLARKLIKFRNILTTVIIFIPLVIMLTFKISSIFAALSLIFVGS